MEMTFKQITDLIQGETVTEKTFHDDPLKEFLGLIRLMLRNCRTFMQTEGITPPQGSITLEKLTLRLPGMAGVIQVTFSDLTYDVEDDVEGSLQK